MFLTLYLLLAGRFLIKDDGLHRVDAIVILGGDSVDFHRTKHGVSLYNQGVATKVVLSGLGNKLEDVCKVSLKYGLKETDRTVIDHCHSTYDEARSLVELTESNQWESIVLVTDIYHSRRAVKTFGYFLKNTTIHSSPAENTNYHGIRWWKSEDGFFAVFAETLKLIYYLFRYGINPL